MKILVLNAGSSSIKYKLFNMADRTELAVGLVERIGEASGRILHKSHVEQNHVVVDEVRSFKDHEAGLAEVVRLLLDSEIGVIKSPEEIAAIGHRVVHGGEKFGQPTIINEKVIETIDRLASLAPLHNPANLSGIRIAQTLFPTAVQTAIFDTAFHQTLSPRAYRYAIPDALYTEHGIRVYGFHGTSHQYVSRAAAKHLGKKIETCNLITAHLGNGASITAVASGQSVDTSMGFSPLSGLMMGTRSGDLDPAVIFNLAKEHGLEIEEIDRLLNKKSGLLGISGTNDMRDLENRMAAGDRKAALAFDMYCYRIKKHIGMYAAILGRVDALVFTAGVGENSPAVREKTCDGLASLGFDLDAAINKQVVLNSIAEIQKPESQSKILIIRTNEELEIAIQTEQLLSN